MITASAEHAHQPVFQYHAMEAFLAVALARATRLLAGALMVRLIRAFPAPPGPAMGRAASGWPDAGAGVRRQSAGPASQQYREQKGDAG